MSIKVNIDVNLPTLNDKAILKGASAGMLAAAKYVTADAKIKAPVDSGDLRNSIFEDGSGVVYKIGSPLHYAPYVEYGTKYQKPKPFLRPAAFGNIAKITQIVSSYIGRFL